MLTTKQLQKLKNSLPINGYNLIAQKTGFSTNIISHAFNNPRRYKPEVVIAALEVIEELKKENSAIKTRLKQIVA